MFLSINAFNLKAYMYKPYGLPINEFSIDMLLDQCLILIENLIKYIDFKIYKSGKF